MSLVQSYSILSNLANIGKNLWLFIVRFSVFRAKKGGAIGQIAG